VQHSGSRAAFEIGRVATVPACAAARMGVGAKGIEPEVAGCTQAPVTPGSPAKQYGAAGAPRT
jgi:hypothetical protein